MQSVRASAELRKPRLSKQKNNQSPTNELIIRNIEPTWYVDRRIKKKTEWINEQRCCGEDC